MRNVNTHHECRSHFNESHLLLRSSDLLTSPTLLFYSVGVNWQGRLWCLNLLLFTSSLLLSLPPKFHLITQVFFFFTDYAKSPKVVIVRASQWEQLLGCHINPCCLCKCTPFWKVLQKYDVIQAANHCLYNYAIKRSRGVLMNDTGISARLTARHTWCAWRKNFSWFFSSSDVWFVNFYNRNC